MNLIFADAHPTMLSGLTVICSKVPNCQIVGRAKNSNEMVKLLKEKQCDILLTDYSMPGGILGDGLDMLAFVRRIFPHVKVIVFTEISYEQIVHEVIRLGIKTVLNKKADLYRVVDAIQEAYSDQSAPSGTNCATPTETELNDAATLTRREVEVIRLYVEGASVTQIAQQLHRTAQTISTQKSSAMKKLGLRCDLDLFCFAYRKGILPGSARLSSPRS